MELTTVLQNNYDSYQAFAAEVAAFHERCAMPPHIAFAVDMALEELLTNIIKYGYDDAAAHTIQVTIRLDEHALFLQIEDDGHPFDPTAAPEPDLSLPVEERPIGGLGLALVRKNFASFAYERIGGRNRTQLRLSRSGDGNSAGSVDGK